MKTRKRRYICAAQFLFAAVLLLYCDCRSGDVSAAADDGAPLPDTVTVAFYNVENLFDYNLDGTEYDEYKPGWFGWTESVQRKKLGNVARVIAALGADIIGLCEIENENALKDLQRELDKIDVPYPYAVAANAPGSATVTALLSKFPIRENREYPIEKSRPILEALISSGGDELRVFVNHWPSKAHPESKRMAAAETLKRRLSELPAGTDYIVIGDFNANHDEFATFHTAGHNDTKNITGINHVLKTVVMVDGDGDVYSPTRFVCKGDLSECADCHYNLWMDLPEDGRMSYVYKGAAQTIDNILVPQAMFDSAGFSYLPGSFEVFTLEGELLRDGAPYRWQMTYKGKEKYHAGHGYSDHLPIKASVVKAGVQRDGTDHIDDHCEIPNPEMMVGDFEITVDGWMSGNSRFSVKRCKRNAKTGTRSLRVSGLSENANATAAKVKLLAPPSKNHVTMSVKGSGSLSVRLKRHDSDWVYYNAPDFGKAKSARYKSWESDSWKDLKIPLPPITLGGDDVYIELRAGKGETLDIWIDKVRLE